LNATHKLTLATRNTTDVRGRIALLRALYKLRKANSVQHKQLLRKVEIIISISRTAWNLALMNTIFLPR